jgi:hypothetical protein
MASQLQAAQKGHSTDSRRGQAAYRFQTQFWLGAILARGELHPAVPTPGNGRSPDFLVELGMSQYGVEIKRPHGHDTVKSCMIDAVDQLTKYGIPGTVVLDLTEALTSSLQWVSEADAIVLRAQYIAEAQNHLAELKILAYDSNSHAMREGFERVNGILIFSRGWSWLEGEPRSLVVFAAGAGTAFSRGRGKTVAYYHSTGLLNGIVKGLRAAGFEFDELHERQFPL